MKVRKIGLFLAKIQTGANDMCWPWVGALNGEGYGVWTGSPATALAHRLAYILFVGDAPAGFMIRHTCDNRRCCNPFHLITGTAAENTRDMIERGRHWRQLQQAGLEPIGGRARRKPSGARRPKRDYEGKLDPDKVRDIRRSFASGELQRDIALRLGVHETTISNVVRRWAWAWVEDDEPLPPRAEWRGRPRPRRHNL